MMNLRNILFSAILLAGMLASAATTFAQAADPCTWSRDVKLINGKILTMDTKNSIVNEVTIQGGHFTGVGKSANQKLNTCTKVIDLKGRAVVPGLIDNHNHFISLGLRPGYDVRLETAWSIAEIQDRIRARIKALPSGAFITATGGWSPKQLAEKRMPTMAELDAAAPNNPVYIAPTGQGGQLTNTLGKKFFESKGVSVNADGTFPGPPGFGGGSEAIGALRTIQSFDDEKRGMMDAEAYSASLGLTVNLDQGFFYLAGTPDLQDSRASGPGIETFSPWTFYNAAVALDREGKLTTRLRIFWYTLDTAMDVPILRERLMNNFPYFGDDMLRNSGVGETVVQNPAPPPGTARPAGGGGGFRFVPPANEEAALQLIAKLGYAYSQHSTSLAEDMFITDTFEKVNKVTPIANLRWSISHVPKIDEPTLNRLKAMGAGVMAHSWQYLTGNVPPAGAPPAGPPFRMIIDNGIHVGGGSDAVAVTSLDPWLMIYYMVTGKNSAGDVINPGQQITRMEALRLYTANNGWFLHEEDKLGSIETGKLGDLVVLSADYSDPSKVSDQDIRNLKSVLTVVGGKVVYDDLH
jgi:predicted amidohydrolase YtcJ